MPDLLQAAVANLLSPMVLCFALGFLAASLRSDLAVPEAVAKGLSLYLMFAIGFKGGVELSRASDVADLARAIVLGLALSFGLPFLAFLLLRLMTALDRVTAAATAAHYGSISVVTFMAGEAFLRAAGVAVPGSMVAVVALMETPAILSGLLLAGRGAGAGQAGPRRPAALLREVLLNGSVVLLLGAFLIGWITGEPGMARLQPFVVELFPGLLALFLLDLGLVAARSLRTAPRLGLALPLFAWTMPPLAAALALAGALLLELPLGPAATMMILAASASYIAVPAAMRLALPRANPGIYVTLSLCLTFPFNITVGLPLYLWAARQLVGG